MLTLCFLCFLQQITVSTSEFSSSATNQLLMQASTHNLQNQAGGLPTHMPSEVAQTPLNFRSVEELNRSTSQTRVQESYSSQTTQRSQQQQYQQQRSTGAGGMSPKPILKQAPEAPSKKSVHFVDAGAAQAAAAAQAVSQQVGGVGGVNVVIVPSTFEEKVRFFESWEDQLLSQESQISLRPIYIQNPADIQGHDGSQGHLYYEAIVSPPAHIDSAAAAAYSESNQSESEG